MDVTPFTNIALTTSSQIDSRTIIDSSGAEKLFDAEDKEFVKTEGNTDWFMSDGFAGEYLRASGDGRDVSDVRMWARAKD